MQAQAQAREKKIPLKEIDVIDLNYHSSTAERYGPVLIHFKRDYMVLTIEPRGLLPRLLVELFDAGRFRILRRLLWGMGRSIGSWQRRDACSGWMRSYLIAEKAVMYALDRWSSSDVDVINHIWEGSKGAWGVLEIVDDEGTKHFLAELEEGFSNSVDSGTFWESLLLLPLSDNARRLRIYVEGETVYCGPEGEAVPWGKTKIIEFPEEWFMEEEVGEPFLEL